ncbi:MAG TPA: hypothetical protein VJ865_16025 [Gemmatimonadaceae bacterium]|nr:hypothetical protein [Gemmatimonadaceae bacterium]
MPEPKKMFDGLVTNAIDFMQRSAAELEDQPKYSVIDFFAGVELFLKARLLLDHWSLVIAQPERADLSRFLSGDFTSVGFKDAVYRLRHVVNEPISEDEEASFNSLREHRNKLVHFFHDKYTGAADASTIADVVSEQCKAWFYIHRLLSDRWAKNFAKHKAAITHLDAVYRRNRRYLGARWEALEPEIKRQTKQGGQFLSCNFCGYGAGAVEKAHHGLYATKCRVCEAESSHILVKCQDCTKLIEADDVGQGECACGFELDWDYLARTLSRGRVESPIAFCTCGYGIEKTVIPFDKGYLCLSCHETGLTLNDCEWCAETHLGELEASYIAGCTQCEGNWDDDDS